MSPAVISLKSVYPHRELTSSMDSQSMVELELAPAGVVIVKIKKVYKTDDINEPSNYLQIFLIPFIHTLFKIMVFALHYTCSIFSDRALQHLILMQMYSGLL